MRRHRWTIAVVTFAVLLIADYAHEMLSRFVVYRALYLHHQFYFPESIDKLAGAALCVIAVCFIHRTAALGAFQKLGLSAPVLPAITFALIVSSPMLIGFVVTRRLPPHIELLPVVFSGVFSPLVEEIEFRGFGVKQFQDGSGWPFWAVVWPSALLFGLGHIDQGQSMQEKVGLFLLTGVGGVIFAWLVYRWQNLWVAVALHSFMNLWWRLFSVSKTAIGGWFDFTVQSVTMLLAIVVTVYWTRPRTTRVLSLSRSSRL